MNREILSLYNRQDLKVRCLITASKGAEIGGSKNFEKILSLHHQVKEAYTLQFNSCEILSLHNRKEHKLRNLKTAKYSLCTIERTINEILVVLISRSANEHNGREGLLG